MSFAQTRIATTLDLIGQRYSVRPSAVMGLDPLGGRAVLYDFEILKESVIRESVQKHTTGGAIQSQRASWPEDIQMEVAAQQKLREAGAYG